jgi:HEAT repeat protein
MVFPDRDTIVNMVVTLKGVAFPQPGIFLVELLLDNQWVADTTVELTGQLRDPHAYANLAELKRHEERVVITCT